MRKVNVYSMGPLACSVCAEKNLTPEEVAQEVNKVNPAGTEHGWQISEDEKFKGGETNPCVCENDADRLHYLFEC